MHTATPIFALALALLLAAPAAAQSGDPGAANAAAVQRYAGLETVVVTAAAEGAEATIIWIAESGGTLYIRTNRRSAWGNAVESAGALSLTPPGDFTATRVTNAATMDTVNAAFRKKYGFSDVMTGLMRAFGGGPRIFRLQPKLSAPEAATETEPAEEQPQ